MHLQEVARGESERSSCWPAAVCAQELFDVLTHHWLSTPGGNSFYSCTTLQPTHKHSRWRRRVAGSGAQLLQRSQACKG